MLIDSHCHVPHKKYGKSPNEIIGDAKKAGVEKVITVGTSIKTNEETLKVAQDFENVYSTIGIYPNDERDKDPSDLAAQLEQQTAHPKVVGIGECGLDITAWKNQRPLEEQILLFEKQVELAIKLDLPLIVHNRNGDKQILEILTKHKNPKLRGVAHCFVGNWPFAKKMLDLNFMISFSGIITYKSGKDIHETVENVPLDSFLVETDAPYLPPEDRSGKRAKVNEPKYVRMTAEKVAEIKNLPLQEIEKVTYENTCSLFLNKI